MVKMETVAVSEVLHDGYGRVRKRGFLSKWSEKWLVLRRQSDNRSTWLDIHCSRRTYKLNVPPTSLPLDGVIDVATTSKSDRLTLVTVTFRGGSKKRLGFTYLESKQWCENIRQYCLHREGSSSDQVTTPHDERNDRSVDEDDDVFHDNIPTDDELTPRQETFQVWVKHSPKMLVSGTCVLTIDDDCIYVSSLSSESDDGEQTIEMTWPLGSLRRYGYDSNRFTFEAGRRCATGEGMFTFKTSSGKAIQEIVERNTERLAEQVKNDRSQSVFINSTQSQWTSPSHNMSVGSCFSDSFAF